MYSQITCSSSHVQFCSRGHYCHGRRVPARELLSAQPRGLNYSAPIPRGKLAMFPFPANSGNGCIAIAWVNLWWVTHVSVFSKFEEWLQFYPGIEFIFSKFSEEKHGGQSFIGDRSYVTIVLEINEEKLHETLLTAAPLHGVSYVSSWHHYSMNVQLFSQTPV